MEVYLVPIGRGRHALYCEPGEEGHGVTPRASSGWWRRMMERFSAVVAAVEREHADRPDSSPRPPATGFWGRARATVLRWIAEKVAEQRLLWRLGGQQRVCLSVPDRLDADKAVAVVHGTLSSELKRHAWWLAFDSIGAVIGLILTPIPGPNLIGYYFSFRVVGHLLAIRGARHGLHRVRWDVTPSSALSRLDGLAERPIDEREAGVRAVAEALGLPRLTAFYRRTARGFA